MNLRDITPVCFAQPSFFFLPYFYRATYNKDLSSELCNIVPCEKIIKTASRKVSFRKFARYIRKVFLFMSVSY